MDGLGSALRRSVDFPANNERKARVAQKTAAGTVHREYCMCAAAAAATICEVRETRKRFLCSEPLFACPNKSLVRTGVEQAVVGIPRLPKSGGKDFDGPAQDVPVGRSVAAITAELVAGRSGGRPCNGGGSAITGEFFAVEPVHRIVAVPGIRCVSEGRLVDDDVLHRPVLKCRGQPPALDLDQGRSWQCA